MKMSKLFLTLFFVIGASGFLGVQSTDKQPKSETPLTKQDAAPGNTGSTIPQTHVLVHFQDTKITVKDVMELIKRMLAQHPGGTPKDLSIDKIPEIMVLATALTLLQQTLIEKSAQSSGIAKKAEFQEKKKELENALLKELYIRDTIETYVTEKRINEFYKTHQPSEVSISSIIVKTKDQADRVLKELRKNPGKFSEIARKYSIDPSASKGGLQEGFMLVDSLSPPLRDSVQKTAENTFTDPAIQTSIGFIILKVNKKRQASQQSAKAYIVESLKSQALKNLYVEKIKENKSEIQMYNLKGEKKDVMAVLTEMTKAPAPPAVSGK